jgi:dCTP diphosphatase
MACGDCLSRMSAYMTTLEDVTEAIKAFAAERDWNQFHDPKNLAMAIAAEAGELLAELRWVSNASSDGFVRDPAAKERIEREVADVAITLILFSERAGIDLLGAVTRKLQANRHNYPVERSRGVPERPTHD